MPNQANVRRPFVIVGPGRSGTTLVSTLISSHPEVSFVGETANLIFGIWNAFELSAPITKTIISEDNRQSTIMDKAGTIIQDVFCNAFSDQNQYWLQKPIGLPNYILGNFELIEAHRSAEVYWDIFKSCFPEGKYFTVLRHPFDVVLSSKAYWGWDEGRIWETLSWQAQIITHPSSPVNYAVNFDELILDQERTTSALCSFLEIEHTQEMADAFKMVHVPDANRTYDGNFHPSRKESWEELDLSLIEPKQIEEIQILYEKFDSTLDLPPIKYKSKTTSSFQPERSEKELLKVIEQLRQQIFKMNLEFSKRVKKLAIDHNNRTQMIVAKLHERIQNLESYIAEQNEGSDWLRSQINTWQEKVEELQSYIAELTEGNQWLTDQTNTWQQKAEDLQNLIEELQKENQLLTNQSNTRQQKAEDLQNFIEELQEGNQWLTTQSNAWQQKSESLQNYIEELQEGNQWLSEQSNAWQSKAEELEKTITALNNQIEKLIKKKQKSK